MPSIRINKVIRDLNVGLPTVVEFLKKRGVEVEANPNAKISQQALVLCVDEFCKGWSKEEREALLAKYIASPAKGGGTPSEESAAKEKVNGKASEPAPKVGLTIKGHIDLDAPKNSVTKQPEPKPVEVANEKEVPPVAKAVEEKKEVSPAPKATSAPEVANAQVEVPPALPQKEELKDNKKEKTEVAPVQTEKKADTLEPTVKNKTKTVEAQKKAEQPKPKLENIASAKPKAQPLPKEDGANNGKLPKAGKPLADPVTAKKQEEKKPKEVVAEEQPATPPTTGKTEVFRLHDNTPKMGIKVLGKVDLSAISNTSKKSEDRKKRRRINNKKVDIEKAQNAISDDKKVAPKNASGNNKKGKNNPNASEKGRKAQRQQQPKVQPKPEITQEEIQKQIKETLAQMQNKAKKPSGQAAKYRRDKREAHRREQDEIERVQSEDKTVKLTEYVTANDLAQMIDVPVTDIITMCFNLGMMVSINQRLEKDTIDLILDEYGYEPEYVEAHVLDAIQTTEDSEEDLLPRAPIVTVMGHVDHGKTSLLDAIRNTNVIAGEAGGITQHVGAYSVVLDNGRKITFLDTPGHEAFTAMRARGAKVTDIVIIVVAADDGVMPQTKEAINHAALAGVPIIFAINKVDKPHANPEKIKEELSTLNYLVEDWGGKYQSQNISAKKNIGISELLEKVLLEADMLELKANPNKLAAGTVLESTMEVGRGYTTKVLIQEGSLHVGDHIIAGTYYGRVKALFNERGKNVDSVGPSDPVVVLGLNGATQAGENFNALETEQEVRSIAAKRTQLQREQKERTQRVPSLANLGQRIAEGKIQDFNIIVKGDVDGSVEALSDSIVKLSTDEIHVNVIHKAVGQISDSDVMLAAASDAVIIGFQVRPATSARRLAENEGVEIRTYSIIYNALDEVKSAMEGMLSPEIKENVTANLEVLETFKISKVGTIAGCMVKEGKISRTDKVRLIRDGIVKYDGVLGSLKRYKDDAKEVVSGLECGLNIENFNDIVPGDIIEAYEEIKVKKKL